MKGHDRGARGVLGEARGSTAIDAHDRGAPSLDTDERTGLNAERGVSITLRSGRHADKQSHPAQ